MNDTKEKHATHTPGPWHAFEQNASNPNSKGLFEIDANHPSGNRQTVAVTPYKGDGTELYANARLIAAAPDLLAQCREFEKCLTYCTNENTAISALANENRDKLREVLAKVEGGEG
jgi:hypothetical protein